MHKWHQRAKVCAVIDELTARSCLVWRRKCKHQMQTLEIAFTAAPNVGKTVGTDNRQA
jgi:hypothetical protein